MVAALHSSGCTPGGGTGETGTTILTAKEAHWGFPGEHYQNWRENRDDLLASDGKQLPLDSA